MGQTSGIDLTSNAGWLTILAHLPDDYEALAKEHKVLETQYGEAKITSATDLLRLVLLHAGANFPLRQTVATVAESGGPEVSHVTLHKKMRLAAPYLKALLGRLTAMSAETAPERWAGYELAIVDGSPPFGTEISRGSCLTRRWHRGRRSSLPVARTCAGCRDRTSGSSSASTRRTSMCSPFGTRRRFRSRKASNRDSKAHLPAP
jgi:hypothetical protein